MREICISQGTAATFSGAVDKIKNRYANVLPVPEITPDRLIFGCSVL